MTDKIKYIGNGQMRVVVTPVEERQPRIITIRNGDTVRRGEIPDDIFDGFADRPEFESENKAKKAAKKVELTDGDQ